MIAKVRQEKILDVVQQTKDVVLLSDLAEAVGASESTIRRDLSKLEQDQRVETLRGGGVRIKARRTDPPVRENKILRAEVKDVIARKAAALVKDGEVIYIDTGSTTSAMTQYLAGKKITVVTSNLLVLEQIPLEGVTFIGIGGEVDNALASFSGPIAESQMNKLYFDKAFLSCTAFSDSTVFADDIREAKRKEIARSHATTTYILADNAKRNRFGFVEVFDRQGCKVITENDEIQDEQNEE